MKNANTKKKKKVERNK